MKGKQYVACGAIGLTLLGSAIFSANQIYAEEDKDRILSGLYIEGVYVGDDTKEEAMNKLDQIVNEKSLQTVRLDINEHSYEMTLSDLGVSFSYDEVVEEACRYGKTGNLIRRYKEQEEIKNNNKRMYFDYELDEAVFEEVIKVNGNAWFQSAQNASIYKTEEGIKIVDEVVGTTCDMEATKEKFLAFMEKDYRVGNISFEVEVMEEIPEITADELRQIEFTVLGTFTTNYGSSSASAWNRKMNVQNATNFINGSVLMPGEEFDTNLVMEPYTKDNGYYEAGSYLNGKVVQSMGGGICQVSSTLYNAVLFAELEVVERYPHSMTVGYVQLSADAAIAGTTKNLVFKNNLDTPIYIEGTYTDTMLTFSIYGKETRPANRRLEFKNEILSVIQPPEEIVTIDPEQPVGYRKVTQSAYTGYRVKLVKYIYENDVLIGTEDVNTSSYTAQPAYVIEGGAEPVEPEIPEDPNAPQDPNAPGTPETPGTPEVPAEPVAPEVPVEPIASEV